MDSEKSSNLQQENISTNKFLLFRKSEYEKKKALKKAQALEAQMTRNAIIEAYEFYTEVLGKISHTLEQAQYCAYFEFYGTKPVRTYISSAKYYGIGNVIKSLKGEDFREFQKRFNATINDTLNRVLGSRYGLNVFRDDEYTDKKTSYEISEEEMLFLLCIFATKKTKDAQNFLCGNYGAVSEEYYDWLRCGVEIILKRENLQISKEEINYRFDVVFGLKSRKIEDEFMYSFQLVQDIILLLEKNKQIKSFDECLLLIEFFNNKLLQIRQDTLPLIDTETSDNPTLEKIVKDYKEFLSKFKEKNSI